MKKSTQWLLGSLIGSTLIWSCSAQQLNNAAADQAKKAGASAPPGTVASALPSAAASLAPSAASIPSALPSTVAGIPSVQASAFAALIPNLTGTQTSTNNCAAVLQCAVNAEPSLASSYNPWIAKPSSLECNNAAIGAAITYPQCKK